MNLRIIFLLSRAHNHGRRMMNRDKKLEIAKFNTILSDVHPEM
jgi:hypothetical protein